MNKKTIANNTTTEKDIDRTVVNAIENNNIPANGIDNNSDTNTSSDSSTKNRVYNIQNLQPVKTKEEARIRGRNGGIKSGEVRRQKKTMRETLENALKIELTKEKLEELGADIGLMNGETSVLSAIVASTIREAIGGDSKSIQFIRDSIGEKPIDEMHTVNETITQEDTDMMKSLRDSLISKVM